MRILMGKRMPNPKAEARSYGYLKPVTATLLLIFKTGFEVEPYWDNPSKYHPRPDFNCKFEVTFVWCGLNITIPLVIHEDGSLHYDSTVLYLKYGRQVPIDPMPLKDWDGTSRHLFHILWDVGRKAVTIGDYQEGQDPDLLSLQNLWT